MINVQVKIFDNSSSLYNKSQQKNQYFMLLCLLREKVVETTVTF